MPKQSVSPSQLIQLAETLKTMLTSLSIQAEQIVERRSDLPVDTLVNFAQSPLSSQITTFAHIIVNGMHRRDSSVSRWEDMTLAQQNVFKTGVQELIDAGYCVVEQEIVAYARDAAIRIADLEKQLNEQE